MPRMAITLMIVLPLTLVSCSGRPGQAATTPSAVAGTKTPASPSSTQSATPAAATSSPTSAATSADSAETSSPTAVDSAGNLATCQLVDTAAGSQLQGWALAIRQNKPGPARRAAIAATYADLAEQLTELSAGSTGDLTQVLTTWATASSRVARYLTTHQPTAGAVIDYGPTAKTWAAARTATEAVCGRRLPSTR